MNEHGGDGSAPRVRVSAAAELPAALAGVGLRVGRPVLVLVGGAAGMDAAASEATAAVLRDAVVSVVERRLAVVVDGGTDVGVMRLVGRARKAAGARFPLVGVAAEGTVVVPGAPPPAGDAPALEPHHTLFVLVPGTEWGDESPWLGEVAAAVAGGHPVVTLLVNGGEIAYDDVAGSLAGGRPVLVLAGTGRTADAIADGAAARAGDPRAVQIAASALTVILDVGAPDEVAAALDAALARPGR